MTCDTRAVCIEARHDSIKRSLEGLEGKCLEAISQEAQARRAEMTALHELLGDKASAREAHRSTVEDMLASHKANLDGHQDRVQANVDKVGAEHVERHTSVFQRLEDLEQALRAEIADERSCRQAAALELREIIGGTEAAGLEQHRSVKQQLAREIASLDLQDDATGETMTCDTRAVCIEARHDSIKRSLEGLEGKCLEAISQETRARRAEMTALHELLGHEASAREAHR